MLRKALEAQGAAIADNPHYDIQQPPVQAPSRLSQTAASALPSENPTNSPNTHEEDDEGVYL